MSVGNAQGRSESRDGEFALHPLFLTFRNPELERTYRAFTDQRHRYFYLMGLVLSVAGWLSLLRKVHLAAPARFTEIALVVGLGLMPLFLFIIVITALDRWRRLFHPLVAQAISGGRRRGRPRG